MKTFLPLLALAFSIATNCSFAQTIINGDFEFHSITDCSYNLTNDNFSQQVNNASAFGTANEIDVQNSSCDYGDPQSGDWFVSIATSQTLETDAFSLEINPPLEMGSTYTMTYYEKADTTFGGIDSLMIGLSLDNDNFGTAISVIHPTAMEWNMRTFTFIAPFAANHMTFQNQTNLRTWTFLDAIQILSPTNTNESDDWTINIFPNPVEDLLSIQSPPQVKIIIRDLNGKIVYNQTPNASISHEIDVSSLSAGMYFIELSNSVKSENFKIQKQ